MSEGMRGRRLVDRECEKLAVYFLRNTTVPEGLTLSTARIERDTVSLAEAIQEAVEDWFVVHPVESTEANQ